MKRMERQVDTVKLTYTGPTYNWSGGEETFAICTHVYIHTLYIYKHTNTAGGSWGGMENKCVE